MKRLDRHSTAVRSASRSLSVDVVTAEVMTALTNGGVPSILLKGPSVAFWLYPAGAGRGYVDTDILVPPHARASAEQILTSLGFVDPLAGSAIDEQDPTATPWQRHGDRAAVDLHRSLRGLGVPEHVAWDVLSAQTEPGVVCGTSVQVLAQPGRALNLALHAAHDGVRNWQCVEDLRRALVQLPMSTWHGAAGLATRLGATESFAAGLRLLPAGQAVATHLQLPRRESVEVLLRASSPPPLTLGFANMQTMPDSLAKLRYLGHNLLPTPAFMRFWSPLARRGAAGLAVAYVWRWLFLLYRALPAYRAWRRAVRVSQPSRPQ